MAFRGGPNYRAYYPSGERLAKIVYSRCKKRIESYKREHPNTTSVYVGELRVLTRRFTWTMAGRTKADEAEYWDDWEKQDLRESPRGGGQERRSWEKLREERKVRAKKRWGAGMLSAYMGRRYGWSLVVDIDLGTSDMPEFDVKMQAEGDVPKAIFSCLKATYNEFIAEMNG